MNGPRPISRLLIANRGEIACRIARSCRALGITPVGVYTEADRASLHTRQIELTVSVGDAKAERSYLDMGAILAAAEQTGADAIHPGYGFLSESAAFAEAVRDRGLIWIGPPPSAMRAMADKMAARRLVHDHGVPTLSGYDGERGQQTEVLLDAATHVGFPLMVKAAAGGGGRGMRLVRHARDLPQAIAAARREAKAAFGDDRLLLERLLERARHVEVQIMADDHGRVLHLFERDCSIQRRQQKIIEEAPAPGLDAHVRTRIGEAAVRVAQLVDYRGAGTVEFLLDSADNFFFLEMNTRLQVEHPVTEAISGLDLVALQIRIAQGQRLPFEQSDLSPQGHAIEARVYAEDPLRDFMPASGTILRLQAPHAPGLRVDSGYESGDEVTIHYDALLMKLIAHGADRAEAVQRLREALRRLWIAGITTNVPLLRQINADPSWSRAAAIDTSFLTRRGLPRPAPADAIGGLLAAALVDWTLCARHWCDHWPALSPGWRLSASCGLEGRWRVGACQPGQSYSTHTLEWEDGRLQISIDDGSEQHTHQVRLIAWEGDRLQLVRDRFRVQWRTAIRRASPTTPPDWPLTDHDTVYVHTGEGEAMVALAPWFAAAGPSTEEQGSCHAPMPATVVRVHVAAGQQVAAGEALVTLEAMKMEQTLVAPRGGAVEQVRVTTGDTVDEGAVLIVLD